MDRYHVHGDNIIECERIVGYIKDGLTDSSVSYAFYSPACVQVTIEGKYRGEARHFELVLFPGFNKTTQSRRSADIYAPIKDAGGYLDETPDAVVTHVREGVEEILFAVEFCSALQAGNQAWQRSGRAASTARSGCPYLYIVDFLKFELDADTRERKNIRYPNPAIPYSYINYSLKSGNFCSQVYVKAEEFQPSLDIKLNGFDQSNFAEAELSEYVVRKMLSLDTREIENRLIKKCYKVVRYLSSTVNAKNNFTERDWQYLFDHREDVVAYSAANSTFPCSKSIARKSAATSTVLPFKNLVQKYSKGIGSKDLPMGVIPANKMPMFISELVAVYPSLSASIDIGDNNNDLIIALIKGFKPKGDDNRPDRGLLPLIAMLGSLNYRIMTFLYGPIIQSSLDSLLSNPLELADRNGLWKSVLALSDFILLDAPVLNKEKSNTVTLLMDNRQNKKDMLAFEPKEALSVSEIPSEPKCIQEDDVDTALHILLGKTGTGKGLECLCNPPGGDWSGMSIFTNETEYRWLSLPRVCRGGEKRPDHITQFFGLGYYPMILVTESKGSGSALESNVGNRLISYVENLMDYIPSVRRDRNSKEWAVPVEFVSAASFDFVSAGAFIANSDDDIAAIQSTSKCDLLFSMSPQRACSQWKVDIYSSGERATTLAKYIADTADSSLFEVRVERSQ